MNSTIEANRALAYTYLSKAAMWPLGIILALLIAVLAGLIWAANSFSAWWLIFLIPYTLALMVSLAAIGIGFALLNAIKPRSLSKEEKANVNEFVAFANQTLGDANSLRGGSLGILLGVLKRKFINKQNLSDAVVEPLKNTPELKEKYKELIKSFKRKSVENLAD